MNNFRVFQFRVSGAAKKAVNTLGWDGAMKSYPEVEIHVDVRSEGSEYFKDWMGEHYNHVANVVANNLDDVFRIGNIGPDEESDEKIVRVSDNMYSVSVGDIIVDDNGKAFMVDPIGFAELNNFFIFDEVA